MSIDLKTIKHISKLSRISVDEPKGQKLAEDLNSIFKSYQDIILLVDKESKNVSSTKGHDLMHSNPYAEKRFLQARRNCDSLIPIMKSGDLDAFIKIVELEALSLHAMMMTSNPYFILIKPKTLNIINEIRDFRRKFNIPICFSFALGFRFHIARCRCAAQFGLRAAA